MESFNCLSQLVLLITNSHYLTYTFLFKSLGYFFELEGKGLTEILPVSACV